MRSTQAAPDAGSQIRILLLGRDAVRGSGNGPPISIASGKILRLAFSRACFGNGFHRFVVHELGPEGVFAACKEDADLLAAALSRAALPVHGADLHGDARPS